MEQYEKSGPKIQKKEQTVDVEKLLNRLEQQIQDQQQQIKNLTTEVQRLKNKLDQHAAVINGMNRRG